MKFKVLGPRERSKEPDPSGSNALDIAFMLPHEDMSMLCASTSGRAP